MGEETRVKRSKKELAALKRRLNELTAYFGKAMSLGGWKVGVFLTDKEEIERLAEESGMYDNMVYGTNSVGAMVFKVPVKNEAKIYLCIDDSDEELEFSLLHELAHIMTEELEMVMDNALSKIENSALKDLLEKEHRFYMERLVNMIAYLCQQVDEDFIELGKHIEKLKEGGKAK